MQFKFALVLVQLTLYWRDFAVSGIIKDSSCSENNDCTDAISFCHKISKMCVCNNGQSNYPTCFKFEGYQQNNLECDPLEYYDNIGKKCKCRFGGMSTKTCCTEQCGEFQTCHKSKCECSFGQNSGNQCRRCNVDCGLSASCKKDEDKYECVCDFDGRFPNCISKVEEWTNWNTCDVNCGQGKQRRNRKCHPPNQCQGPQEEVRDCFTARPCTGTWGLWGDWSLCSQTCGSGTRARRRSCISSVLCAQGEDLDTETCGKEECKEKGNGKKIGYGKKKGKWCKKKCNDFLKCNAKKCTYRCGKKHIKKCDKCINGCTPPKRANIGCQWCSWSPWKVVKRPEDCHYVKARHRAPHCPKAAPGGKPCEGQAEQTGEDVTIKTDLIQTDFHSQLTSSNLFSQTCVNGCYFASKIFHGCQMGTVPNQQHIELYRQECHLKERCRFSPDPAFFHSTEQCFPLRAPQTWMWGYCIGGPGVHAVTDHRQNYPPINRGHPT